MDRCGEAPRLDPSPRTHRSLSVENFLPLEQSLEARADESMELLAVVPRSNRTSDISDDPGLQQVSQNPRVGQTNMAQPQSSEQIQCCQTSRSGQARQEQSSNDEQTQTGRESNDLQKAEERQTQGFSNACRSTPIEPWLAVGKLRNLGRAGDWIWEIVCMFVAVCCLLAIFITLAKFDHQEQPNWPYARTLNLSTLIALLATILRSMLENVLGAGEFIFILLSSPINTTLHNSNRQIAFRRTQPTEMAMVSNILAPTQ